MEEQADLRAERLAVNESPGLFARAIRRGARTDTASRRATTGSCRRAVSACGNTAATSRFRVVRPASVLRQSRSPRPSRETRTTRHLLGRQGLTSASSTVTRRATDATAIRRPVPRQPGTARVRGDVQGPIKMLHPPLPRRSRATTRGPRASRRFPSTASSSRTPTSPSGRRSATTSTTRPSSTASTS
jgi:hypothetical protein